MKKRLRIMTGALAALALVLVLAPARAEARRYYGGNIDGEPGNSTFGIGQSSNPSSLATEPR